MWMGRVVPLGYDCADHRLITSGGKTFSRSALYHLLNNRVYIGEIVHQRQSYPGQHEAILPRQLWDRVAAQLEANNQAHRSKKSVSTPSLLSGIVFDPKGIRFTPTHAVKNGKRYRYYTSQAAIQGTGKGPVVNRFPAQELETLITSQIRLLHSIIHKGNRDRFGGKNGNGCSLYFAPPRAFGLAKLSG